MNKKKLYKSSTDKKLCGGLAEYLGIDATVIRLIWVLLVLCAGTGVLAYIICALILPDRPEGSVYVVDDDGCNGNCRDDDQIN